MTTTVHVLRHGEVFNPEGILYGRAPGFHLSDRGLAMAERVAERTASFDITHVVASPLERAQETAGAAAWRVREGAGQAADTFRQTLDNNPMAVAAACLGVGLAVGLLVPETQQERRLMGETRHRLGEKVQETAADVGRKVQAVAREAAGAAKEAAQDEAATQGLAPSEPV